MFRKPNPRRNPEFAGRSRLRRERKHDSDTPTLKSFIILEGWKWISTAIASYIICLWLYNYAIHLWQMLVQWLETL